MPRRLFLLVPMLAACYNYAPVTAASAPAGLEVRARITGAAMDRVAPLLGTFDVRELTGTIIENNGGNMVLDVPTGAVPNTGSSIVQLRQRVPIGPSDLVSLETRRLDVGRTVLLTGGLAAGVGAAVAVALHATSQATDPSPDPSTGPPLNRIPLWVFRF